MIDVFDFMMDEENGWNEISQEETEEQENIMKAFKNLITNYIFLNVQGNVFEIYDNNENFVKLVSIPVENIEKDSTFKEKEIINIQSNQQHNNLITLLV